jgi:hypothetical protein
MLHQFQLEEENEEEVVNTALEDIKEVITIQRMEELEDIIKSKI